MDSPLTDAQVKRIARILAGSARAIEIKAEIHKELGLPRSDLDNLVKIIILDNTYGAYSFFRDLLTIYKWEAGSEATLPRLQAVVVKLGLKKLKGILEKEYGNQITAKPITNTNEADSTVSSANPPQINFMEVLNRIEHLTGGSLAKAIMTCVPFFQPNSNIPIKIFMQIVPAPKPFQVNQSLELLKKHFFLDCPPGKINIGGIGDVTRLIISLPEIESSLQLGLEVLSHYLTDYDDRYEAELIQSLLPHAESVWKYCLCLEQVSLVRLYETFPQYLCDQLFKAGKYEALIQFAWSTAKQIRKILGVKHAIRLALAQATAMNSLERYFDSVKVLTGIRRISELEFGFADETTLNICLLQAENFHALGKYEVQVGIYGSIEDLIVMKHGAEHPTTIMLRYNKAMALHQLGRLDDALVILYSVYETQNKYRVVDDNAFLKICWMLGQVLFEQSHFKEAVSIFEFIAEPLRLLLGEDHPTTLQNLENIRISKNAAQGQVTEAVLGQVAEAAQGQVVEVGQ